MYRSLQKLYYSEERGPFVGHGHLKIYGKPDCVFMLRHPTAASYDRRRLFWCEEEALAAGYRPCAICMKEHHQLWKNGWLVPHTLEVVEPEYFDGPGLCTVCLPNGSRKTLALEALKNLEPDDNDLYENGWDCYELTEFNIEGDYCIATLSMWGGFWGRVIVWDYVQDRIVHLTSSPFAQCSTIFKGQVVSMYQANDWFEIIKMDLPEAFDNPACKMSSPNGTLWYSAVPLGVIDPEYEPDLCLLPLPVPNNSDDEPNCFDIRVEDDTLIFCAGAEEYRLDSL